mmetsp:Transcript_41582/g.107627  ORF Transcript_41582/g.107627 Transcript_41582/m.107627 type:complete len:214 (+) Transcript_41582:172-813(+)
MTACKEGGREKGKDSITFHSSSVRFGLISSRVVSNMAISTSSLLHTAPADCNSSARDDKKPSSSPPLANEEGSADTPPPSPLSAASSQYITKHRQMTVGTCRGRSASSPSRARSVEWAIHMVTSFPLPLPPSRVPTSYVLAAATLAMKASDSLPSPTWPAHQRRVRHRSSHSVRTCAGEMEEGGLAASDATFSQREVVRVSTRWGESKAAASR